MNQIGNLVDKFVQVTMNGKPNARAKVVGVTAKKAYVQIMEKNAYIKDENGNPKRFLVNADRIKLYTAADKRVKKAKKVVAEAPVAEAPEAIEIEAEVEETADETAE